MAATPSIAVCNVALAEVRAKSIVSIDDESPEARACAIHYPDCLNLLLEAHDWAFATVRGTMALRSVNDRPDEWGYAYALPSDCVNVRKVVDGNDQWLNPVYAPVYPWFDGPRNPQLAPLFRYYVIAGDTLYSNLDEAILEYVSSDIEDGNYPASFRRALELSLASRLAITLLDDRAKKGDLIQEYEAEKRRAMAEDMNRYPRRDEHSFDEVALVRRAF